MPTWKEQLQQIQKLRVLHRENDEKLYAAQINLEKIDIVLRKALQQETLLPADQKQIEALREKIAKAESSMQDLNKKINNIDILLQKLKESTHLVSFLEKKIQAIAMQIAVLNRLIAEEQNNQPPDRQKIKDLQEQLAGQQQLLRQLTADLEKAKAEHAALLRQQQSAITEKEELERKRKAIKDEINRLQQQLNDELTGDQPNPDEAERKKKELEQRKKEAKAALDLSGKNLHDAITAIYADPHPGTAISNLSDETPFLLMPVRIETRFMTTGSSPELWLRIYPDDISVHTHEKTLTAQEVAEGEKYWKNIFAAEKNGGEQKEDHKKDAWNSIVALFGSPRAAWIAQQTKPLNWTDDLGSIENAEALNFPVHDLTKINAWSRAPRTYVMPDKFVVMLYEGNTIVKEQIGNIIPDELVMGPDPGEPDDAFVKRVEDEMLVFGESYDWVSNFDKAIEYGMGFKIPLTPTQASRGIDKVLVLGAYLSADETEGQQAIETMIDNHHYSLKGFSLVKQGTPTNNTEQDGAGFTKNDSFNNSGYFVETGDALFSEEDDYDGRILADALGIEYAPLQHVMNSDATDHKEIVAMNTALYPSTLGYYFDTMLQPVLDEESQVKLRDFFVKHVSGRGPLPAIRVGDQPYGVLLTSDFSKWRWGRIEPVWGTGFLNALTRVLNHYHDIWKSLLNDLAFIGKPGANQSEVLMNILGLQAGSVSFFQKTGYSTDDLRNRDGFKYGERYYNDLQNSFNSKNTLLNFLSGLGYDLTDEDGRLRVPQLLRLVFQHYHTVLDAANIVDNIPLSEKKQISFYDTEAEKNYIHWLMETGTIAALEKQDFGEGKKAPTSLLYMQLRRALVLEINKAAVKFFGKNNIILDQVMKPVNFYNIRPGGNLTKWEVMKAKVGIAVPGHADKDKPVAEYLLTTGSNETEAAFLNAMKESLELLSRKSTASLERCFTEHIDTCSYRLDAWQSAIFDQRLQKQRQLQDVDGQRQRKKGIYIGAYGWIEHLKPDVKRRVVEDTIPEKLRPADNTPVFEYAENGGFVHAPSVNHATAAAVLRSGYLNHATDEQPDIMAVNLSSERIRRAQLVFDGLRKGRRLEELLGYQFERGLHDRGSQDDSLKKLNEYIYNFRDAFTIQQNQVQQQGTDVVESIPANNVVNGLTLAESMSAFPYGATGSVLSATSDERIAIEAEKNKLEDTLDAIKDLLMSESVFQMVQGNPDRAGAVLSTLKDANTPPEIEVINTPRSSHFSFTNRVTIQFETLKPGDTGYNPWPVDMTPRAIMEPGLNKWLKKILGEPGDLVCLVSHTNADGSVEFEEVTVEHLNLQPIDLIYIAGHELNTGINQPGKESMTAKSELESRIAFHYRQVKLLENDIQVNIEFLKPDIAGKKTLGSILPLIRMLKSTITDSRSLHAEDFDPPSKTSLADQANPKGYDHAELLARIQQAQNVYQNYQDDLNAIVITLLEPFEGLAGDTTLGVFFNAVDNTGASITDAKFGLSNGHALQLQQVLIKIAAFGLDDSFPMVSSILNDASKLILLEQAKNVHHRVSAILITVNDLIADAVSPSKSIETKVAKLTEAGKALFGDMFNILALFTYNNVADIQQSDANRAQLLKYATDTLKMNFAADEWLQTVSYVRPRLSKWESIRTLYESFHSGSAGNDLLQLLPVQLPFRANDNWIAVEFPEVNVDNTPFNITHDTLSIVVHGETGAFGGGNQNGLLLDEWTEIIPTKEEITGITLNYDQPNATPPQALLLAVPAVEKGNWNWDELVDILNDTLLRAKLRAVEPGLLDKINDPVTGVMLPAVLANFSEFDLDIALDYRMNVQFYADHAPISAVAL